MDVAGLLSLLVGLYRLLVGVVLRSVLSQLAVHSGPASLRWQGWRGLVGRDVWVFGPRHHDRVEALELKTHLSCLLIRTSFLRNDFLLVSISLTELYMGWYQARRVQWLRLVLAGLLSVRCLWIINHAEST